MFPSCPHDAMCALLRVCVFLACTVAPAGSGNLHITLLTSGRRSEVEVGPEHLRMAVTRTRAYREEYNVGPSPTLVDVD